MLKLNPSLGSVINGLNNNQYEIIKRFDNSSNTYSTVFLAKSLKINKQVVLKFTAVQLSAVAQQQKKNEQNNKILTTLKEQADREFKILQEIKCQHIVDCYEFFMIKEQDLDIYVIVMEHLTPMEQYIRDNCQTMESLNEFIQNFVVDSTLALNYLQQVQVMHRDLKIDNILVKYDDSLHKYSFKFTDFNTSKFADKRHSEKAGNCLCQAPEAFQSSHDYSGTDVWAIGIVLFQMLEYRNQYAEILKQPIDKQKSLVQFVKSTSCPYALGLQNKNQLNYIRQGKYDKIPQRVSEIELKILQQTLNVNLDERKKYTSNFITDFGREMINKRLGREILVDEIVFVKDNKQKDENKEKEDKK